MIILKKFVISSLLLLMVGLVACRDEFIATAEGEEESIGFDPDTVVFPTDTVTYSDWSEATHSSAVDPDFDVVFSQTEVKRMDIVITSSNWSTMEDDLESKYGRGASASEDPIWVESSLLFEGKAWYHVGVRYKGNSSLQSAYQAGYSKLSFKLDFDEFEDTYPDLYNQRFYGFKQLNLNNNYNDASFMREKVGADLFRSFGLASAHTSFYEVYVTVGSTTQYFGLYTLVEEVDDSVLKDQFSKSKGNLYKPDGDAASFAYGTYDTDELELKTNKDSANYSDVQSLYDIVNSSLRTSDVDSWKESLESIFNVDVFLQYLAANNTIQNWDTYGNMTHNYFLYSNPKDGLLTWIPWDNNEAFEDGKQGGSLSFSLGEVNNSWPLIRYIIDQPEYEAIYEAYLQQFVDEVFIPSELTALYSEYYSLLKEYVYAESNGYSYINYDGQFDSGVSTMKSHAESRKAAVISYLQ